MEIKVDCPYCGKERHLYLNQQKGLYHCFRCLKGGKISSIVHLLPEFKLKSSSKSLSSSLDRNLLSPIQRGPNIYWNYAKKRNALQFKENLFRYEPYLGYLIIGLPLLSPFKQQHFFFGRKIALSGPRYRYFQSSEGTIAKSFLGEVDVAIAVEGFFDLCALSESYPTIALLGKKVDDEKMRAIGKCVKKKVIVCLDKDAFQEGVLLIRGLAKMGLKGELLHSSLVKDPGEDSSWIIEKMGDSLHA